MIHSDVRRPIHTPTQGGARYTVTFIDGYSRYVMVYFTIQKSRIIDCFFEHKSLVENQFNRKIKCIGTDNGGEYINHSFARICKQAGMRHQTTTPYSLQQNGLTKRMKRIIIERARSMIHHMHADQKW